MRRFAIGSLVMAAAALGPGAGMAPATYDGWGPDCPDQLASINRIGKARATRSVLCMLNQARRHYRQERALKLDARLTSAGAEVLRAHRYSLAATRSALRRRGYSGSFSRCSPVLWGGSGVAGSPLRIAGLVIEDEMFVISGAWRRVGIAIVGRYALVITGR